MPEAVYEIQGDRIECEADFYREIGEAINGSGGYFGANLDALTDCLRGDFGTPEGAYTIRWHNSALSRAALGYEATEAHMEQRLIHCHPSNRGIVRGSLDAARRHEGPTMFDLFVEVLQGVENLSLELA